MTKPCIDDSLEERIRTYSQRGGDRFIAERDKLIAELIGRGWSQRAISRSLGYPLTSINRWSKALGNEC